MLATRLFVLASALAAWQSLASASLDAPSNSPSSNTSPSKQVAVISREAVAASNDETDPRDGGVADHIHLGSHHHGSSNSSSTSAAATSAPTSGSGVRGLGASGVVVLVAMAVAGLGL
jgi:hypothetical protein